MLKLPKISSYGQYKSDNYGAHCLVMSMAGFNVYFSYQTPVAFSTPKHNLVVRENIWGPTTGKHLNWIDGGNKHNRVTTEKFNLLWEQYVIPSPLAQCMLFDV